jgi:hypothetical protein
MELTSWYQRRRNSNGVTSRHSAGHSGISASVACSSILEYSHSFKWHQTCFRLSLNSVSRQLEDFSVFHTSSQPAPVPSLDTWLTESEKEFFWVRILICITHRYSYPVIGDVTSRSWHEYDNTRMWPMLHRASSTNFGRSGILSICCGSLGLSTVCG